MVVIDLDGFWPNNCELLKNEFMELDLTTIISDQNQA